MIFLLGPIDSEYTYSESALSRTKHVNTVTMRMNECGTHSWNLRSIKAFQEKTPGCMSSATQVIVIIDLKRHSKVFQGNRLTIGSITVIVMSPPYKVH